MIMPSVESWSCAFGTSKLHHNNRTTAQMEVYRLQDIFGLFEHKIHEQRYFASRRLPRPKLLYSAFFNRSFFSIWNDIKDIQPPYVMKPATSSGSHGTKLVRTYGEAKEALRKVYARDPLFDDWHLKDQLGGVLLVEQVRGFAPHPAGHFVLHRLLRSRQLHGHDEPKHPRSEHHKRQRTRAA